MSDPELNPCPVCGTHDPTESWTMPSNQWVSGKMSCSNPLCHHTVMIRTASGTVTNPDETLVKLWNLTAVSCRISGRQYG